MKYEYLIFFKKPCVKTPTSPCSLHSFHFEPFYHLRGFCDASASRSNIQRQQPCFSIASGVFQHLFLSQQTSKQKDLGLSQLTGLWNLPKFQKWEMQIVLGTPNIQLHSRANTYMLLNVRSCTWYQDYPKLHGGSPSNLLKTTWKL